MEAATGIVGGLMADLYLSLGASANGLSFINVPEPELPLDPMPGFVPPATAPSAPGEDEGAELALLSGQVLTLVGFDSAVGGIFTI